MPSGLYSITNTYAIMFYAAAGPCTHACSSQLVSNLSTAYNNPSYIAHLRPMQWMACWTQTWADCIGQQACFILPNVRGRPDRRGRVPAIDSSRIAVQQHPARLTIPGCFNGNLAGRELACTYGSTHCLILTPNRIQFCTRDTICARIHFC